MTCDAPTVRLAWAGGPKSRAGGSIAKGLAGVHGDPPALLASYFYIGEFLANRHLYRFRDWMLDSGAFSAYNRHKVINIDEYIKFCIRMRAADPRMVEVIALDVIGDGRGSLRNSEYMRSRGVLAVPVFHIGEDWGILDEYCAGWPKVGLSCRFGESRKESLRFYDRCFSRAWPKRFHSFGWMDKKMLMDYPFHSADSSTWVTSATIYGRWQSMGRLSQRGNALNLTSEVEWYLRLERSLRVRWFKEMLKLGCVASRPLESVR